MPSVRFSILAAFVALSSLCLAAPMTVKELEFLVRQRTPEADIMRDLAARRLVAPLDAEAEQRLKVGGVSAALLAQIKSGAYLLPPQQAQAELARQAAHQQKMMQEAAADQARAQGITQRNNEISARLRERGTVQRLLHDNLVTQSGGRLHPVDDAVVSGVRVFAFLAASASSGPSKQFMPKMVAAYRDLKEKHPEFEVVFISVDRDEFNMTEHMRAFNMPWPAVKFKQFPAELAGFFGEGQPWLVLVGDDAKPLSQNGADQKFIEPERLLDSIDEFLTLRASKAP